MIAVVTAFLTNARRTHAHSPSARNSRHGGETRARVSPPVPSSSGTVAPAVAVTCLAVAAGVCIPRVPPRARAAANLATAALALAVARRSGLTWSALGIDRTSWRRGLRTGTRAVVPVAGAVGVSVAIPALRALYADDRVTSVSSARAAYETMVRIPFGTVLSEELLFRGAVLATAEQAWGSPIGVAVSSVVFGVWHVLPALEGHVMNPAGARLSARFGGLHAHVGGTVLLTALAGVAFATLRQRSRSVVAPFAVHAALNVSTYLAARWAHPAH